MSESFDLHLMPVARLAGQEQPELVGLHVAKAPRRAARGRDADRLVIYFAMEGNASLPPGKHEEMLDRLAKVYFKTSGSVTAALRMTAEELNKLLFERNLRSEGSDHPGVGLLTLVVLRDNQAFLSQSGSMHAFYIGTNETRYLHDVTMIGRGLGQARTAPIIFYQVSLQPNDLLLLTTQPSPVWNSDSLTDLRGRDLESLPGWLFPPSDLNLNAVLIQAKPGPGAFVVLSAKAIPTAAVAMETGQAVTPTPPAASQGTAEAVQAAEMAVALELAAREETPQPAMEELPPVQPAPVSQPPPPQPTTPTPVTEAKTEQETHAKAEPRRSPALAAIGKPFVAIGAGIGSALRSAGRGIKRALANILPDASIFTLPSSTMAFIAIAVPVLLVTIASVTYFRLGSAAQYQALYTKAEELAAKATSNPDPQARRGDWEGVLEAVTQAEGVNASAQTQALRQQALRALDELDLVRRVQYEPAIVDGLPDTVNVSRMMLSGGDLYLLDANSGNVVRTFPTPQGYEVDPSFQCGPGPEDAALSGALIDIIAWPGDYTPKARLVAMDARGNLLYCAPGDAPQTSQLAPAKTMTGGDFAGFTFGDGNVYLLDPASNAVWIYWDGNLEEEPQLFFNEAVPPMQDVIDLAESNNQLYLLHADGKLTVCLFSDLGDVAPTRCSETSYIDFRPGHENTPITPPPLFSQIQYNQPPDPSLYFLEPEAQAIYHFSLRNLAFQRQYLPETPLDGEAATAFAHDPLKRLLFLAIGDQVYYAGMP